jgi:hypothetical protein
VSACAKLTGVRMTSATKKAQASFVIALDTRVKRASMARRSESVTGLCSRRIPALPFVVLRKEPADFPSLVQPAIQAATLSSASRNTDCREDIFRPALE